MQILNHLKAVDIDFQAGAALAVVDISCKPRLINAMQNHSAAVGEVWLECMFIGMMQC